METAKTHLCKTCHWGKFNWCKDGAKVSNVGDCKQWRPIKLSKARKAKDAAIQKAAHVRDKSKKMKK